MIELRKGMVGDNFQVVSGAQSGAGAANGGAPLWQDPSFTQPRIQRTSSHNCPGSLNHQQREIQFIHWEKYKQCNSQSNYIYNWMNTLIQPSCIDFCVINFICHYVYFGSGSVVYWWLFSAFSLEFFWLLIWKKLRALSAWNLVEIWEKRGEEQKVHLAEWFSSSVVPGGNTFHLGFHHKIFKNRWRIFLGFFSFGALVIQGESGLVGVENVFSHVFPSYSL